MSALNVSLVGKTALVAVDTQFLEADGSVGEASKFFIIPHTNLLFAGRGLIQLSRQAYWECLNTAPTFDKAVQHITLLLPKLMDHFRPVAQKSGLSSEDIAKQSIVIVAPGYRGMRAMQFDCTNGATFTSKLIESNDTSMGSHVEVTGISAPSLGDDLPRTVYAMAALTRRQVASMQAKGIRSTGGRILVAELTSHGYSQQSFEMTA